MGELVVLMIRTAMEAFAKRDLDLCMQLPTMDDPVDRLNRSDASGGAEARRRSPGARLGPAHEHGGARARARRGQRGRHRRAGGFLVTGEFREFTDASHEVDVVTDGSASADPPRVEDEESLAESVRYSLEREGFAVTVAADGRQAIERFRADDPDLVILDLMLPEISGLDVCRLDPAELDGADHHGDREGLRGRQGRGPGARRRRLRHEARSQSVTVLDVTAANSFEIGGMVHIKSDQFAAKSGHDSGKDFPILPVPITATDDEIEAHEAVESEIAVPGTIGPRRSFG